MKVNLAIGQLVWVKSERDVVFIGSMVLIIAGTEPASNPLPATHRGEKSRKR